MAYGETEEESGVEVKRAFADSLVVERVRRLANLAACRLS